MRRRPVRLAAGPHRAAPVRFITLNGDFTDHDEAWADLDRPFPGESWSQPNVPSFQLTWLEAELAAALAAGQRVIVFVHYRLDGRGGPAGTGLGPPLPAGNAGWVDDCTLENAAVVRALLEQHPGLVLATFSGHDHAPKPAWSQAARGKPAYFTHAALVEGSYPASNAYSVVTLAADCSLTVRGFGNASSAVLRGPPGCAIAA